VITITLDDFQQDFQGKRFTDVLNDTRLNFQEAINFFNDEGRLARMEDSEIHHDRPALAGVIKELEEHPPVQIFLSQNNLNTTFRFRQAVGVLVRLHMEQRGWKKTGSKGSLGTRGNTKSAANISSAGVNKHGLSKWFTRAERYVK
jgi:hypothetical protein